MRGHYNDVKPLEGKTEQEKETDALVPSLSTGSNPDWTLQKLLKLIHFLYVYNNLSLFFCYVQPKTS